MLAVPDLYTDIYPVKNKKLKQLLIQNTEYRKVKKGEFIFYQGEKDNKLCFLESGVVIANEICPDGHSFCYNVVDRVGNVITGGLGMNERYSPVNIIMQSSGGVFSIAMERLLLFMQHYPEVMWFYNQILLKEYEKQRESKKMLYLDSAADRYAWFLEHHPVAAEKVSDKVIARYLRMSPVTLSRLKNKSSGKNNRG